MRRTIAALVAAALVLLTPGLAEAAPSSSKRDPQGDVDSRLDMKRVHLAKQGKNVVVTFTTWTAFTDADIARPGGIGIDFELSKKKLRGSAVRWTSTGVYGEICTYTGPRLTKVSRCSKVAVSRVSDTSYRLTIPLTKIDRGARTLKWRASSLAMNGFAGCSSVCVDGVGTPAFKTWRLL